MEDYALELNTNQGDQIVCPTMHDEQSNRAKMDVDHLQIEDRQDKDSTV